MVSSYFNNRYKQLKGIGPESLFNKLWPLIISNFSKTQSFVFPFSQ